MDLISFSSGVYKLIREKVKALQEHLHANKEKNYEEYLKLTGQIKTLEELEQDIKELLDKEK